MEQSWESWYYHLLVRLDFLHLPDVFSLCFTRTNKHLSYEEKAVGRSILGWSINPDGSYEMFWPINNPVSL